MHCINKLDITNNQTLEGIKAVCKKFIFCIRRFKVNIPSAPYLKWANQNICFFPENKTLSKLNLSEPLIKIIRVKNK